MFGHVVALVLQPLRPSTSLCVYCLPASGMQRDRDLDHGGEKWAQCVWVLSPCGVIVDRDGSASGRGQRRANASPHRRTRGRQLFGLHRYCCCFPMILDVMCVTYPSRLFTFWDLKLRTMCVSIANILVHMIWCYESWDRDTPHHFRFIKWCNHVLSRPKNSGGKLGARNGVHTWVTDLSANTLTQAHTKESSLEKITDVTRVFPFLGSFPQSEGGKHVSALWVMDWTLHGVHHCVW